MKTAYSKSIHRTAVGKSSKAWLKPDELAKVKPFIYDE
jgi:hypothetical protein